MESIIEKKCVSIEPRAMHWVDHCVCLFLRKLREKRKKKVFGSSPSAPGL